MKGKLGPRPGTQLIVLLDVATSGAANLIVDQGYQRSENNRILASNIVDPTCSNWVSNPM